jgi:general L-amino acid transport system permease protein
MSRSAFVRTQMLPAQEPPLSQRGAMKWARENLFSGWLNSILTVVSLGLIYLLLSAIVPFFANSIWSSEVKSLDQCREVLNGANGGCFSVITERWQQLLYGFYPKELYWRANTTLLLLFVALWPILATRASQQAQMALGAGTFVLSALLSWGTYWLVLGTPLALAHAIGWAVAAWSVYRIELTRRWLLAFSALYPFVLVWLVWGGSVWGPLMAVAGFGLGYAAFRVSEAGAGTLGAVVLAVLVPVLWWIFLSGPVSTELAGLVSLDLQVVESRDLGGFMISIIIGLAGIALSLPLGVLLALGRKSDLFIVKTICVGFIEFIRGVPLITLLFTASLLLNYFLPPGTNFDIVLRVIIMVTIFSAAYMAETIRGGLAALPKGQYEAADSLGLDYWKAQRLIIMPQALKVSIPGIVNNFIGLFKDTTLVTFIGIYDILGLTSAIRANAEWHGIYWELYIFVGAAFFVSCFSMGRYSQYLERKLQTDRR